MRRSLNISRRSKNGYGFHGFGHSSSYFSLFLGLTSCNNVNFDSFLSVEGSLRRTSLIFAQATDFSSWFGVAEGQNCEIVINLCQYSTSYLSKIICWIYSNKFPLDNFLCSRKNFLKKHLAFQLTNSSISNGNDRSPFESLVRTSIQWLMKTQAKDVHIKLPFSKLTFDAVRVLGPRFSYFLIPKQQTYCAELTVRTD